MNLALILIPALIALAMFNRTSAARIAYRVYLPCLLFVPVYLVQAFGGFLLSSTNLVAFMLCLAGLSRWRATLKLGIVDLCVLLYAFSAFYADAHLRSINIAFYVLCQISVTCVFPYFIGRTLIEQTGARKEFVKSLVFCFAVVALVSVWEYRMEANPFQEAVERITNAHQLWGRQTRWGFGRIAGPYGHAILAGMMFSTALFMQLWLVGTRSWENSRALRFLRTSRRAKFMTGAICLGLFMTQSRGPWIGCGFGLIVASIGFAKDRRRFATIAVFGLLVALLVTSVGLDKYTAEQAYTGTNTGDADQQNAAYRRNLLATYEPLIAVGGIWGWGTPQVFYQGSFGWTSHQTSIDNEYIRIAMAQGYFGLVVFLTILLGSGYRAIRLCILLRNRQDIIFAFCLLGALVAMTFTLTTVFLGDPMIQVAFILFGWLQSVGPTATGEQLTEAVSNQRFAFKRVFA